MTSLSNVRSLFNKKVPSFKSSKDLTLFVKSDKDQNSGYPKWLTLFRSMMIMNVTSNLSPITRQRYEISLRNKIVIENDNV